MTARKLVPWRDLKPVWGIRYGERHLRRMWRRGAFPKPVKLGDAPNSRLNFLQAEIEAWLEQRVERREMP